jgi:hypothetical protein
MSAVAVHLDINCLESAVGLSACLSVDLSTHLSTCLYVCVMVNRTGTFVYLYFAYMCHGEPHLYVGSEVYKHRCF